MSKVSIINNVTVISLAAAKAIDSDGSIWNEMNQIFGDGKGNFSPFENALLYCQKEPLKVEGQIAELMTGYTAACAKKNFDTLQDTLLDDSVENLIDYTEENALALLIEDEVNLDLLFTYKEAPIEDVAAAIAAVLPDAVGKEQLPNAAEGIVDPVVGETTEEVEENPTPIAEGTADEGAGDDEEVQSNLPVTANAPEGGVANYGDINLNLNGLVEAVATVAATNQTVAKTNESQAMTNAEQAKANALLAQMLSKAGAPVNAEDITAEPVVAAG